MIDGQHRCAAIVKANVTVQILVAYDCDPETYTKIDTGLRRTPGDSLFAAGYSDVNNLASAARLYYGYRANILGPAPWSSGGGRIGQIAGISSQTVLETIQAHPALTDYSPHARAIANGVGRIGFRNALLTGLAILSEDSPVFSGLCSPWIDGLSVGANLPPTSPLFVWRKWAIVPERRSRAEILATFLKAWNGWQDGAQMTHVRISRGEAMPTVRPPKPKNGR